MTIKLYNTHRHVQAPPGFAERSCVLVHYRLPGLPHCFSLCHEPRAGEPAPAAAALMAFFLASAGDLALAAVGDAEAFVLVHNGAAIRRRPNWHLHVFVVRRRWQKAWIYAVLATKNLVNAILPSTRRPAHAIARPAVGEC